MGAQNKPQDIGPNDKFNLAYIPLAGDADFCLVWGGTLKKASSQGTRMKNWNGLTKNCTRNLRPNFKAAIATGTRAAMTNHGRAWQNLIDPGAHEQANTGVGSSTKTKQARNCFG